MKTFECPNCQMKQQVLGHLVAHRCHMNKNKMTHFVEVVGEAKPTKSS